MSLSATMTVPGGVEAPIRAPNHPAFKEHGMAFTNVGERWRVLDIHGRRYAVSDQGNVANMEEGGGLGRIRKVRDHRGYSTVTIKTSGGRAVDVRVHRMVMLAFVGPCPDGMQVNHKDLDRSNNHLWNLEYVTPQQNTQHAARILHPIGMWGRGTVLVGEKNQNAKLNDAQAIAMRELVASGRATQAEAARLFGVSRSLVCRIVSGERWKHVLSRES